MITHQQRIEFYIKLVAELRELEMLRERVKTAELLLSRRRTIEPRRVTRNRTKPRQLAVVRTQNATGAFR